MFYLNKVGNSFGFTFKSQFYQLLVMWPWGSYLTTFFASFSALLNGNDKQYLFHKLLLELNKYV